MNRFLRSLPEKLVYFSSSVLSRIINGKKDLRALTFKNILCIKLDEIGDLCYTLHVFGMLKKQYPQSNITLLCKPFAASLTRNDPNIDKVTSDWNELKGNYDLIIDLRGNWRSIFYAMKVWPKARLDRGTVRWANRGNGHPHEVLTNLQIVEPIIAEVNRSTQPRIYPGQQELDKVIGFLREHRIERFAMLHTGARKALRKWNQYALLGTYLKKEKGLEVLFTGDLSDVDEIDAIRSSLPFTTYNTAGKFNLAEFAALVSKATVYVGNESGPLHIAAVAGTPVVGLYGPGEPYVFYPWSERAAYVHHVLECNPCDQVHCVHPESPCITRITLGEVCEQLEKVL